MSCDNPGALFIECSYTQVRNHLHSALIQTETCSFEISVLLKSAVKPFLEMKANLANLDFFHILQDLYLVLAENFTKEKANLACRSLNHETAIYWKSSVEKLLNKTAGNLIVGNCKENAESLLDCKTSLRKEKDSHVVLLCGKVQVEPVTLSHFWFQILIACYIIVFLNNL